MSNGCPRRLMTNLWGQVVLPSSQQWAAHLKDFDPEPWGKFLELQIVLCETCKCLDRPREWLYSYSNVDDYPT